MQSVNCSRWIPFSVDVVYETLTSPEKLASVVKRLHSLTVLDRQGNVGSVLAVLDMPGGKVVETKGKVDGDEGKWVRFSSEQPFPLEIKWEVTAEDRNAIAGTQISYTITVDFSPLVAFVSGLVLKGFLSTEMEQDLDRLVALINAEYSAA